MGDKLLRQQGATGDRGAGDLAAPQVSQDSDGLAAARLSQAQMDQVSGFQPAGQQDQQIEDPAPLSSAQVADALRYYNLLRSTTDGAKKYTSEIVSQIQGAVNAPVTGTPTAEMAQGVARRQIAVNRERKPNPPLAVDGKAGPRTLPILFAFGMAEDKSIDAYVKDAEKAKPEIDKATSDADKAAIVARLLNARLAAAGVPAIDNVTTNTSEPNRMFPGEWRINFQPPTLADTNQALTFGYHEARHAEQAFRIARMLAQKGKNAAQIVAASGIHPDRAQDAIAAEAKAPMSAMEALEAEGWHEKEIGKPTLGQAQDTNSAAAKTLIAAIAAFRANPSAENRARLEAAFKVFKRTSTDLRNQPGEFDANFLQDKVGDKLGVAREPEMTLESILATN